MDDTLFIWVNPKCKTCGLVALGRRNTTQTAEDYVAFEKGKQGTWRTWVTRQSRVPAIRDAPAGVPGSVGVARWRPPAWVDPPPAQLKADNPSLRAREHESIRFTCVIARRPDYLQEQVDQLRQLEAKLPRRARSDLQPSADAAGGGRRRNQAEPSRGRRSPSSTPQA